MSNALGSLFSDIADAIREKTGETGTMKPAQFPEKILGIQGGSFADVRYVTFMSYDGTVELGKKAVAAGDDCADPIARGVFATPTKTSTAQYSYTFLGWSKAVNGGLDDSALRSVTEDRTLYAAYAEVLRYYTIRYWDGDTLAHTEQLAYGSTPTHTIEKKGYYFEGWDPAPVTVTGDADYYATWSEKPTFANMSWAEIAEVCENGQELEYFEVGDEKEIVVGGEQITVAIAGIDHDNLVSGGKATLSIVCMDVTSHTTSWGKYNTIYNSYCALYKFMENTMLPALPEDLRAVIKPVKKEVDSSYSNGANVAVTTVSVSLWPLSLTELGLTNVIADQCTVLGTPYELFPVKDCGGNTPSTAPAPGGMTSSICYTRHLCRLGSCMPYYVRHNGDVYRERASESTTGNVRFGFCV